MNKLMEILRGKRKDKKGFTLMEMLIVVAIIAILVAIAVPTFNASLNKAKQAADDANIRTAYMQRVMFEQKIENTDVELNTAKDEITMPDSNAPYELKYYESINDTVKPWVGVPKGSSD